MAAEDSASTREREMIATNTEWAAAVRQDF
jgi:hypothetical protein